MRLTLAPGPLPWPQHNPSAASLLLSPTQWFNKSLAQQHANQLTRPLSYHCFCQIPIGQPHHRSLWQRNCCHPCQPYNGNITWLCQFFSTKQRRVCSKLSFCAWFPTFKLAHLEGFVRLMSTSRASLNNFGGIKTSSSARKRVQNNPPHTKKTESEPLETGLLSELIFFMAQIFIWVRNFIRSLCAYWPRFVPGSKAFWFDNTFRNALPWDTR